MVRGFFAALVVASRAAALTCPLRVGRARCGCAPLFATGFGVDYEDAEEVELSHDYARCGGDSGAEFDEEALSDISDMLALRSLAKRDRNYKIADELRDELAAEFDVYVCDRAREWRSGPPGGQPCPMAGDVRSCPGGAIIGRAHRR